MNNQQFKKLKEKACTIKMFSKEGWKEVNENQCIKVCTPYSFDRDLGDGFVSFQQIFYEDNNLGWGDLTEKQEEDLEGLLVNRFSEYLIGD